MSSGWIQSHLCKNKRILRAHVLGQLMRAECKRQGGLQYQGSSGENEVSYEFMLSFHKCFLKIFIYLFLDRKRKRETSMHGCLLHAPTGDLAHNPGMCPDWELNW